MATVSDILATKGRHVWTIHPGASVLHAVMLMNEHGIGSLVVIDQERIVGVFTERDVLRRVVGDQRHPGRTFVGDVLTRDVYCCKPDTSIEEARVAMKDRRVRHLPVVDDDGHLLGLISIGDLNAHQATSQERTIYSLQEYIYGRV
jgi:CBS domain-containing protein